MFFEYLKRGLVAGLVAGLAFGVFMAFVGNPFVGYADALAHGEGGHGAETGGDDHHEEAEGAHEESVVSTAITKAVSVLASGFWGLLFGAAAFGIAFYFLEPAIPGIAGTKSYLMAAAGFVTVSGAPWLALPPVAPGMEQSLPTQTRLLIYGGMMIAGALACGLGGYAYNRLSSDYGRVPAALAALAPLALLPAVAFVMPANTVTGDVPAALVTTFEGFVVAGQVGLWFVLASAHAWLQRRSNDETPDVDAGHAESESVTA